jgi:hypothetical protein
MMGHIAPTLPSPVAEVRRNKGGVRFNYFP